MLGGEVFEHHRVPTSSGFLTGNLRTMEDAGLVRREVFPGVPSRVEYSLTETGRTLKPVLDALWAWGEGYKESLRLGKL